MSKTKLWIKRIGMGLGLIVLVGALFGWHEWSAAKPFYLNNYLNRFLAKVAMDSPEMQTQLGFLEGVGITGHNAHLDDYSMAASDKFFADVHAFHAGLLQYDDEDLSEEEQVSKRVTLWLTQFGLDLEPYRYHNYPMNPMNGSHTGVPSFMDTFHAVNDGGDAENYISRLSEIGRVFSQEMESLEARKSRNIVPPTFIIERNLETLRGFVGVEPSENILYTSFVTKMEEAGDITDKQRERFAMAAETIIRNVVYPAYDTLIEHFESLLPLSDIYAGIWKMPDGDKVYQLSLKLFNTTDKTPDEIHQIGLSEVARIQAEILEILAGEGIDTSGGFKAAMDIVKADESHYFEDSDAGREAMLAAYTDVINEMYEGLDAAFSRLPKAGVEVRRIQAFQEKTTPAHYNQPALDGSRPGIFYANLYDVKAEPKYGIKTLSYHEAVPGHHLQVALAMELEGLPFIRRIGPFSAFVEGWALYAEQLAWEMGYVTDPYDNVGRLLSELFRSVRLVVDTGIHAKRWTREEAITYMMDNVANAESDAVREIERYIVMPGQATAYKIGMIEILALREQAKEALGEDFDIREFHAVVLEKGALPLTVLREQVEKWIADKQAA